MKKLGFCLFIIIIAVVLALLLPWENLSEWKDGITGKAVDYASLKVYSLGGDMKVYIDGEEKGTVSSESSYLEIFPIEVGKHEVKLVRDASNDSFYQNFLRTISFEKGFDTVISWELGPSEDATSGWVLYARKSGADESDVKISLESIPDNSNIQINDDVPIVSPIRSYPLTLDRQHKLVVAKSGYQSMELPVLPGDDEERLLLKGYELFLEVDLYKLPV
ncbi:MAG: PEGA domain-containing protein [Patescibacteria group bacterium]|nr:PEGA domain-containing protein [Patescibacteria group bacterium]